MAGACRAEQEEGQPAMGASAPRPARQPRFVIHVDRSGLGVDGRVYWGVGAIANMFHRLETSPPCWPCFCLEEVA
eukprot:845846-Pyramimonas_sp.AAC.1